MCKVDPYRENHTWHAARLAALRRDGWACRVCGAESDLNVHHETPVADYRDGCGHHLDGLVALCTSCHRETHAWLRSGAAWFQPELALAS